jgi:exodeoxyribonuclease VII large subunit
MDEASLDIGTHIYTPSELNQEVKLHLEAGFPRILLEAEISNLSRPASGHLYFSLKDESAQIRCAMFRSAALRCQLKLSNGSKVIARGRISLFEARGEYQFIVDGLQDAGAGELQRNRRRKTLAAEGLFDPALKGCRLPAHGRDHFAQRSRDPGHPAHFRRPAFAEVRMRCRAGFQAPRSCAAGSSRRTGQVLILGRGVAPKDLQAFNEESARAVRASAILISAVGHEPTSASATSLLTFAHPPSAAAELTTRTGATQRRHARHARMLGRRMQARCSVTCKARTGPA